MVTGISFLYVKLLTHYDTVSHITMKGCLILTLAYRFVIQINSIKIDSPVLSKP